MAVLQARSAWRSGLPGGGQAIGGELAGAAVRDAFDDLAVAEPAQVVADLAAGHVPGIFSRLGGEEVPQVAADEAGGPEREGAAGRAAQVGCRRTLTRCTSYERPASCRRALAEAVSGFTSRRTYPF
jgi:hypothetical protein